MGRWLYHDDMYRFGVPQPSWWEASDDADNSEFETFAATEQCDVAIIGGGYTGLSAAYHLCRDHDIEARVLEAGHVGWGASGRNGGFCCVGGDALGSEAIVRQFGETAARDYSKAQVAGVQLVHDLLTEERIDADVHGDSELAVACSPKQFERLRQYAEFQFRVLGLDTKMIDAGTFRETCFDSPVQHGAAMQKPTFGLHPLKYVRGLARAAAKHGAAIHTGSEVVAWDRRGPDHILRTAAGGELRAKKVIVAGNGFMPEHLRDQFAGRTLPMISAIVVTRPMTASELALHAWKTTSPTYTSRNLLDYFRVLPDGRLLFGGRGSARGDDRSAAHNFERLIDRLYEVFPGWRDVDIEYRWHGLVCMTRSLTPGIGRLDDDPGVWFGFGYHGNGVSAATWAGQQLARWISSAPATSSRPPEWLPAVVHGLPGRFPLAGFRLAWVRAAIASLRVADRLA